MNDLTTETRTLTMAEANKVIRAALKGLWPQTQWSVRASRGTAALWVNITWTDGPTDTEVRNAVAKYQGNIHDRRTNTYYAAAPLMVGDELVRFPCEGILRTREIGDAGRQAAAREITKLCPGLVPLNDEGQVVDVTLDKECGDRLVPGIPFASMHQAIRRAHASLTVD